MVSPFEYSFALSKKKTDFEFDSLQLPFLTVMFLENFVKG